MPVRIRLARHGRKHRAHYYIVAADSRSPRDGKFIEKLGFYNPNTNPATIELDFNRALHWLNTGAQPSDTARSILSKEGVMMKKHLLEGVRKGAFDEAKAEEKFNAWVADKRSRIVAINDSKKNSAKAEAAARLEAEKKVNEDRQKAIAEKKAAQAKAAAEADQESATEEATEAPAEE